MDETVPPVDFLDGKGDAVVETALDCVAFDTQNPPGQTSELVHRIEEYVVSLGLEPELFAVDPAKPNLLVTIPGERDETLLYNGHLDSVPFDRDEWTRDPLGERDGNRIYGRGATDMKGAVAAMLETIRAFAETNTTPPVTLEFAFVSDEETGGEAGLAALLDADKLDADGCVIGETTCEQGRHSVTVGDKGSIWLTLTATGDAAHGSRPMLGKNAIDCLYDAITELRERFGTRPLSIDDELEPIIEESVAYYEPMLGRETARDLFDYPTINLGTLSGGEAINSVPVTATAEIDIRLTPGIHTPDVLSAVRDCVGGCEGVTITDVSWSVGTYEAIDSPLVEAVAGTAEAVTEEHVYRRSATGGGDAKKLRNAGIPTVEFGLGTDTVHAVDEYTTVGALVDNSRIYATLPYTYADQFD
ncbi:M20 family metallopeptidase [Haladaptatus sp. NG-SE-30]